MIGVGFALSGTLVRDCGIEERAFERVVADIAVEFRRPIESAVLGAAASDFAASVRREPQIRHPLLRSEISRLLGVTAPEHVVAGHLRTVAARLAAEMSVLEPEARETLAKFAALNLPHAFLSNGWSAVEHRRAALLGSEAPVLLAEDTGFAKPDAGAFMALAGALRLPPEQIYYVAADPLLDIVPAAELGFRTVWLNRAGEPFPQGSLSPEHTIAALPEMLPFIAAEYTQSALALRYILHNTLAWRGGYFVPGVEYGLNDPETLRSTL